jgi:hypothetical protein
MAENDGNGSTAQAAGNLYEAKFARDFLEITSTLNVIQVALCGSDDQVASDASLVIDRVQNRICEIWGRAERYLRTLPTDYAGCVGGSANT